MAATPEVAAKRKIQRELKRVLDERGLPHKLVWNAGNAIGVSRLDMDGVIAGHPVVVEVKRFDGKGKLSARQKSDLADFAAAGARTFVIDSDHSLGLFLLWVVHLQPRHASP